MSDAQILIHALESFPLPAEDTRKNLNFLESFRYWGELVNKYRSLADRMSYDDRVTVGTKLSSILSILITEFGCSESYLPLPEEIAVIRSGKKFDFLSADTETVMVYFTHKTIEALAVRYAAALADRKTRETEQA